MFKIQIICIPHFQIIKTLNLFKFLQLKQCLPLLELTYGHCVNWGNDEDLLQCLDSKILNILCTINFAIVLYGSVHQHRILSFIFWPRAILQIGMN